MLPLKRLLTVSLLIGLVLSILSAPAYAQSTEPTTVIDAVFNDLGQKLGRTVTRRNADAWDWNEAVYPDASIGCPQPGQTYAQGDTRGYKITITVNGVVYDYRAVKNTGVFFRCSPPDNTQPPPIAPTVILPEATAIPAPATSVSAIAPTSALAPTSASAAPIVATVTSLPVASLLLAYIAPDGNVHVLNQISGADTAITQDAELKPDIASLLPEPSAGLRRYGNIRWSPDGSRLLFNEFKAGALYFATYPATPGQPSTLFSAQAGIVPGAWSPDGSQIAYVNDLKLEVLPVAGDTPRQIALLTDVCGETGGGTFDPARFLYDRDVNHDRWFTPPYLAWTAAGIIHNNRGCNTATLIDSAGKSLWTISDVLEFALSPDQKRAVVLQLGSKPLLIIDVATGQQTALQKGSTPAQHVAWTADGSAILYVTGMTDDAPGTSGNWDSALGQQLFTASWPLQGQTRTVNLWRLPAVGGARAQLLTRQGFGIGTIAAIPDNQGVVVSFTTSAAALVKAVNDAKPIAEINANLPRVELLYIQFNPPTFRRIGVGGQPVYAPANLSSSATAVEPSTTLAASTSSNPAAALCPGAPPSRLIIGEQGRVTPGIPNDLRATPAGASIGKIPGGAVFTVLQGPVCTANGIAWWQVSYNGQTGWTAEGQGSTYFVEPIGTAVG